MTNYVWNGVDGNWWDTSDWTPTGFPLPSDDAFIGGTGSYAVTTEYSPSVGQLYASVLNLTMDDAAATLDLSTGGGLSIGSVFDLEAGNITGNGTLFLGQSLLGVGGGQTLASGTYVMEPHSIGGGEIAGTVFTLGTAAVVNDGSIIADIIVNNGTIERSEIFDSDREIPATLVNNGMLVVDDAIYAQLTNTNTVQVYANLAEGGWKRRLSSRAPSTTRERLQSAAEFSKPPRALRALDPPISAQ